MPTLPLTHWIWLPDYQETMRDAPIFVCFRKSISIAHLPGELKLKISADTRYKLYVNGCFVEYGPARGDRDVWFADEVDIAPWLRTGENVVAAEVLRYPIAFRLGNFGMARTTTPGLYIEDLSGGHLTTDQDWKCTVSPERKIRQELRGVDPLLLTEEWTSVPAMRGWTEPEYDDRNWVNAQAYNTFQITASSCPGDLSPRPIPFMKKINRYFSGLVPKYTEKERIAWDAMLMGKGTISIPGNSQMVVEIDAGEETTGFLSLCVNGGAGATVKILCAECYYQDSACTLAGGMIYKKGDRTDVNGILRGTMDCCHFIGNGSESVWESWWYRTFRYVQLSIETKDQPLEIKRFTYQLTGYPLNAETTAWASDPDFDGIWDISLRTLCRCMQETYIDCPFYEQLQYIMDARSEALYTYSVSGDDRLARQALDSFMRSQRSDGLLNACYPYGGVNVIPSFSIYYILMLHDHMMYFGDRTLIHAHLGTVDKILHYFDSHLDARGMVGKIGGLLSERYWSFIDWATVWKETLGVPPAGLKGPLTMESMLYIYGLQHAAQLCDYVGRYDTAEEYRTRAARVQMALNSFCRGASGFYQDGPSINEYSQHAQVFAVLTGTVSREEGRALLMHTLEKPKKFAQCTVASMFYLFRALEKVGAYEKTEHLWDFWRGMLNDHLTTCVENDTDARSDCHAWGSLILYELPSVILGVRPAAPGYEKFYVEPTPGYLIQASGKVRTPWGIVCVDWKKTDGVLDVKIDAPEEAKEHIVKKGEMKHSEEIKVAHAACDAPSAQCSRDRAR